MIPVLYDKNEKQFRTYGLGELSDYASLPEVKRVRNGGQDGYFFYMTYENDGVLANELKEGMQIKASAGVRTKWQTFDIKRVKRETGKHIEVWASHISLRTMKDVIKPNVAVRQATALEALRLWNSRRVGDEEWDVWSDINTVSSTTWDIDQFQTARDVLGGVRGSILDVWGGEYEFDNRTIRLHKSMGRKAATLLEYGRNITSLEQDRDESNIYTSVYPFARHTPEGSSESKIYTMGGKYYVDGKYIDMYNHRKVLLVDFSSEFEGEDVPTAKRLRELAERYAEANEVGSPHENLKVQYIDLSQTLDYEDYQVMEEVELNDNIPIVYKPFDIINRNAKVVSITYYPTLERNKEIELGIVGQRLGQTINSGTHQKIEQIERQQNEQIKYLVNAQGNRVWYDTPNENMEHKVGDIWFEKNGLYTRLRIWNGNQWIVEIDTEDMDKVSKKVEELSNQADKFEEDLTTTTELANNVSEKTTQLEQSYQDVKASTDSALNKAVDAYTDAQSALAGIDGIEIGGRNLLLNTNQEHEASPREYMSLPYDLTPVFEEHGLDQEYTMSFDLKSKDTSNYNTINVYPNPGTTNPNRHGFPYTGFQVTTEYQRFSMTFKPTDGNKDRTTTFISVYGQYDTGNFPMLRNIKLEKGNIATDWTPAPEDVDENIANAWRVANEALSDVGNLDQSVQQEFTNIDGQLSSKAEQTTVNEINRTVQNQGSELLQAQNMIAAKADQTDVDTLNGIIEANSAELSVLAGEISAKADKTIVDELNQSVDTLSAEQIIQAGMISERLTRTEVNSEIERRVNEMAGGEFNLEGFAEVEYVENLIENTADSFSQSIENVRKLVPTNYENRNLLLGSNGLNVSDYLNIYHIGGTREILSDEEVPSGNFLRINDYVQTGGSPSLYISGNSQRISRDMRGKRVTISMYVRGDTPFSMFNQEVGTSWTRVSHTFTLGTFNQHFYIHDSGQNIVDISSIQIERGNKATDWSPAPEDLQNDVTILRSDYERTAEEVTDRLTKIDGNNGYISEIRRDVGSLSSSITEYENGTTKRFNVIESDVKGTKQSVADLEKGTSSQFNVMSDEISAVVGKVNNIGGRNLIRNSNDMEWTPYQGSTVNVWDSTRLEGGQLVAAFGGNHDIKTYHDFTDKVTDVVEGELYTFSVTIYNGELYEAVILINGLDTPPQTLQGHETKRLVFTGTRGSNNLQIQVRTTDIGIYFDVAKPKLEKGEVATGWSPAPEDGVSKNELISEINIQADRQIFRVGDNRLMITEDTTFLDNAVIKSAHIADLAVTGAKIADASISSAKIINLDVDKITGHTTNFIQSNWNNISTQISIDDRGINVTGSDRWRRTYFNQTGFELFNGSGAYNKAGAIGYFKPSLDVADWDENVMLSERGGTPRHLLGIGVNSTHDLALGFNKWTSTNRVFSPAIEIRGDEGDVRIVTELEMNNKIIRNISTARFNQINTEIGTWDGSLTYRANRHHRFFSSNNQELFNIQDNGYANLYARLNMHGHDVYNQSDERLKRNIMPSFKDSLGKFSKLEFKWFEYLENRGLADGLHHGVMAQDVLKFAPEWVVEDEQGYYSLNQSAMLMDAFKAIMQLSQKVKKLEAK